jgi:hypothetical protein
MNPFAVEARIRDLADQAATTFLSPLSEKRASPEWISKNAEKVLLDAGADLTKVVTKIAFDENLNPHEVARVCEEANKEVFGRLYKSSDDKTFSFPVADASVVLGALDRPYEGPGDIYLPVEHPKYASGFVGGIAHSAAHLTPKKTLKAAPDVAPTATTKSAAAGGGKFYLENPTTKQSSHESNSWARSALIPTEAQALQLQHQEEKDAFDAFKEFKLESEAGKHQAALDFAKMARDMVLEGERTPSEIFAMVKEARPGKPLIEKAARELLALVTVITGAKFYEGASDVVKYAKALIGVSETGGGNVPSDDLRDVTPEQYEFWTKSPGQPVEAFIGPVSSGGDRVRIVNGSHKLFVNLDTLVDQSNKEGWGNKGLLLSGDRVRSIARNVINWRGKSEGVA